MTTLNYPAYGIPRTRRRAERKWGPLAHKMGRLFTAGGILFNSSGIVYNSSGGVKCCMYQARKCSDNTLVSLYVDKSQFPAFPATAYFKNAGDATCYYVTSSDGPYCNHTPVSPTFYTDCASCSPALYEALSCADGVTKRYVRQSDFPFGLDVNGKSDIVDSSDGRCFSVTTNVAPTGSTPVITAWTDQALLNCNSCCRSCDSDPTHFSKPTALSYLMTYAGISTPGAACSAILGGLGFGGFAEWSIATLSASYCVQGPICPCGEADSATVTVWPSPYTGFKGFSDAACTTVQACNPPPVELIVEMGKGPNGEFGVRIFASDNPGCTGGTANHVYFLGWTPLGVTASCTATLTIANTLSIDLQPTNSISTLSAYFPWETSATVCGTDMAQALYCGTGGTVVLTPHMTTTDCT